MTQICPICKKSKITPTYVHDKHSQFIDLYEISCTNCGNYQLSPEVVNLKIFENYSNDIYRLSAAIFKTMKQNEVIKLTVKSIPEIIKNTIRKIPLETIDDMLDYTSQNADSITDWITFSEKDVPRFILKDTKELYEYLLQIEKMGYWELKKYEPKKESIWKREVRLTIEGWKKIDDLRRLKIDSNQAFVAMWFKDSMDQYYREGIKPALEKTGFSPIINVKYFPHNDKIDDLIFAQIRKSGLLIAEFTGDRSAVYFEAGFAKGLNIPVIWLCKESDKDKLCFDTRQYNHIIWKDVANLKEQLINRIEATIPGHLAEQIHQ